MIIFINNFGSNPEKSGNGKSASRFKNLNKNFLFYWF